jgi:thioredoxin 1
MKPAIRWSILAVVVLAVAGIFVVKSNLNSSMPADNATAQVKSAAICDTVKTAQGGCCANGDSTCCPGGKCAPGDSLACATDAEMAADNASVAVSSKPAALPRFLELGSVGCKACADMAPIVEELKRDYAGRLVVEFYDVRMDPAPAEKYGIKLIPTQIFLDGKGKEIFRHEGFLPKEDFLPILAKLGVK